MSLKEYLSIVMSLTLVVTGAVRADYPVYRSCPVLLESVLDESQFGIRLRDQISESLFNTPFYSEKIATWRNRKIIQMLREFPIPETFGRKMGITSVEARSLIAKIEQNPVTGMAKSNHYDPDHHMGFCFGRAMTAHLLALEAGISNESILKFFAVGHFKSGGNDWRYHVTTLVRATNGDWWTIDSFFGYPMRPAQWYEAMLKMDRGDMNLFVTESKRFGPDGPLPYSRRDLSHPEYRGYFNDLLHFFRGEAKIRMPISD
jgi:hypothetical protein